jgi:hypothetical protein
MRAVNKKNPLIIGGLLVSFKGTGIAVETGRMNYEAS